MNNFLLPFRRLYTVFPDEKLAIKKLNLTDVIKMWGADVTKSGEELPLVRRKRQIVETQRQSRLESAKNVSEMNGNYEKIGGKCASMLVWDQYRPINMRLNSSTSGLHVNYQLVQF